MVNCRLGWGKLELGWGKLESKMAGVKWRTEWGKMETRMEQNGVQDVVKQRPG